ncbi:family 2A encapsulin nanocompartment shell protein [Dyadobacter flavalbus]|nr:family 2A encapsulin nanocompartment shell protein [Dyadobacter flavalbus]
MLHPDFGTLEEMPVMQLSEPVRTVTPFETASPRWLCHLLNWVPAETGVFRLNKVREINSARSDQNSRTAQDMHRTFIEYHENPREYVLKAIETVINIQAGASGFHIKPFDQINEQFRLAVEYVRERQEDELINNQEFGLLNNVATSQTISTKTGPPTPDDLDELLTKVWKQPGFFLLHPKAIAAFGRECTRRNMLPLTVSLFGATFLTWRGIPLLPSDKIPVENGLTKILLLRTGETRQGVVGLYQPELPDEQSPGLSVRFTGINDKATASYLVSVNCSLAVTVDDAVAVLENVDTGQYYE